jgi:hypothetical protein
MLEFNSYESNELMASSFCFPLPHTLDYNTMKLYTTTAQLSLITLAAAHSWLGCTSHDTKDILKWMQVSIVYTLTPSH